MDIMSGDSDPATDYSKSSESDRSWSDHANGPGHRVTATGSGSGVTVRRSQSQRSSRMLATQSGTGTAHANAGVHEQVPLTDRLALSLPGPVAIAIATETQPDLNHAESDGNRVPGPGPVAKTHFPRRPVESDSRLTSSKITRRVPPDEKQQSLQLLEQKIQSWPHQLHVSPELRQTYGRTLIGNSMLVARRLVEAGVPFISVHAENFLPNGSFTYDMHENNFAMLKEHNLPVLDTLLPALVDDLDQRGLLDSTLIYVMGEMGRSPKVNAKAGRDHWPQCGFCLMIGGGIKPGAEYGTTDAIAAYPASDPVSPADIVATIYQQLGIDPHMMLPDRTGRPISIAHGGQPIWDIIG